MRNIAQAPGAYRIRCYDLKGKLLNDDLINYHIGSEFDREVLKK